MHLNRRTFLETIAMAVAARAIDAATPYRASAWGSPVIDCHFHLRPSPPANFAHLAGSGVTQAFLLCELELGLHERVAELQTMYPGCFPGYAVAVDVTEDNAATLLTQAVKAGAKALGEIKYDVAADSPQMRRMYALAGELGVPILLHFQEAPLRKSNTAPTGSATTGGFNTGFKNFNAMLSAFPKTTFVGHANAFWANVSADYADAEQYPTGPVVGGGLTDRWLTEYPNLFGDLSAKSGYTLLSRDADFTADFLARHQDKLIFGSDCPCTDGKGGVLPGTAPKRGPLEGKCIGRETLSLLQKSTTADTFLKLTWTNGRRVYGLPTRG